MKTENLVSDKQLARLLQIQIVLQAKSYELSKVVGGGECDRINIDNLSVVLDILGVPADNTVETNACERANETGVWPEDAFCRDGIEEPFLAILTMRNLSKCGIYGRLLNYIGWVRKKVATGFK